MGLPRERFTGMPADLDFSIEMPVGFVRPAVPKDPPNMEDPTACMPLMVASSAVALALLTVVARPAYPDGTVRQWMQYLCNNSGIELTNVRPGHVGGATRWHPAMLADGHQVQDGTELVFRVAMFEDGGRLVIATAICPKELEASFMPTLAQCAESIELLESKGATAGLEGAGAPAVQAGEPPRTTEQREIERSAAMEAAVKRAESLVADGEDEAAEAEVLAVDDQIAGRVRLGRLFTEALRREMRAGQVMGELNRERAEALYTRAVRWRLGCYPDPHTEIEAEEYRDGMAADVAELRGLLGWTPAGDPIR